VAAVGFELYVSLLDDAVEELRSAGDGTMEAPVKLDVDVDAYLPPEYIPFEAAKIDVHRRVAGTREPGELRALRDELRDRFGPLPEPVANLLELQRGRIELGRLGARTVEFRGERLSVTPLELDATATRRLREQIPEAMYESRVKTLSVRVPGDPDDRLAAVLRLAESLGESTAVPLAA
jgi:transcription-repair coupling factor (superfamily II helicase)